MFDMFTIGLATSPHSHDHSNHSTMPPFQDVGDTLSTSCHMLFLRWPVCWQVWLLCQTNFTAFVTRNTVSLGVNMHTAHSTVS